MNTFICVENGRDLILFRKEIFDCRDGSAERDQTIIVSGDKQGLGEWTEDGELLLELVFGLEEDKWMGVLEQTINLIKVPALDILFDGVKYAVIVWNLIAFQDCPQVLQLGGCIHFESYLYVGPKVIGIVLIA
jgi:hypothetical protein